jgi:EAL domain-containing protein (putative c-di-GMP-specific phosphodiesterase class I)/GGDEF domain-containing protein
MSLMRQLWLAVLIATVVAFSGSLSISLWSAKSYLVQQIERKNSDVANSLALAMTHQSKDQVSVDLQVAALFDTGFYQEISVTDPLGKVIAQRLQDSAEADLPAWFSELFPIPSKPGRAQVNEGWKQYANIKIVSHNQFAYLALWEQLLSLLLWFGIGGTAIGFLGMPVLRAIGRSLGDVVRQADAIGERRFITIAEPHTPEFRTLARAMNGMVERVRQMFVEETLRLDELQRRINVDPISGLPNRDHFMAHFHEELTGAESARIGVLIVLRLPDLHDVNAALGHTGADKLLQEIGQFFMARAAEVNGAIAGRIKAGDVALILPGTGDAGQVGRKFAALLNEQLIGKWSDLPDLYHFGSVCYERGDEFAEVLAQVDQALAVAEDEGKNAWHAIEGDTPAIAIPGEQWRTLLTTAVATGKVHMVYYPVIGQSGTVLHREGMVRLRVEAEPHSMTAADFMPIAAHLNLTACVDLAVVRMAIDHLGTVSDDVAVNLSGETLRSWSFHNELSDLLKAHPQLCTRLWFEVSEYGAFKHFDAFKNLCRIFKSLGCHVGVESFGHALAQSGTLMDLGLDYVKLHSSLVQGINANPESRELLLRLCGVAHSVGILVIASCVRSAEDWAALRLLGVDAATGPAICD